MVIITVEQISTGHTTADEMIPDRGTLYKANGTTNKKIIVMTASYTQECQFFDGAGHTTLACIHCFGHAICCPCADGHPIRDRVFIHSP